MSLATIVIAPHPALRQVAKPVTIADKKISSIVSNLHDTLQGSRKPQGVGLAAPQIDAPWRMFVTFIEETTDEPVPRAYINPRIVDQSDRETVGINSRNPDLEGCLSIPHLYGPVFRPEWVTLEWQDFAPDGQLTDAHTKTFFDFPARVVQHELDHLNGVLFIDHILEQGQPLYQVHKDELVEVQPEIARALQ